MRVTVLRHSVTYFSTSERQVSLKMSMPRSRIAAVPESPSCSCASASIGSPWQSQPKRRST